MENKVVEIINNKAVIDSRKAAEMVGKRHTDLLRDIDRYVSIISQNAKLRFDDFFIEQTYTAGTGKNYKCYDITKQEGVKKWIARLKYSKVQSLAN